MVNDMGNVVTASQAANILGCSAQSIVTLGKRGQLSFTMTPLGRLFDRTDVEAMAKARSASRS